MPTTKSVPDPSGFDTNPRVASWYEARALRSKLSADTDRRKLRLLLTRLDLDPESVVAMAKGEPERLHDALVHYAGNLKRAGRTDAYVVKTFGGLRNYLRFRRADFDGFPKLSPVQGSTLVAERVPTPEELRGILERLTLRGRAIALLLAHTGVRPQVLGTYTGDGGLTLGNLPDLDVRSLEFREIPFLIRVPGELSKTRRAYYTFGTNELAATLRAYLGERKEAGESFSASSPLVAPIESSSLRGASRASRSGVEGSRRFLVTKAITDELRDALHAAASAAPKEVTWRPYVLRSYCSTRLLLAEGDGRIQRDLREAILGHDGGVSSRYNVGKRWGEELLAEARRQYANASEFLETTGRRADAKDEVLKALLAAVEEATGKKGGSSSKLSGDALIAALKRTLSGSQATVEGASPPTVVPPRRAGEQRVVEADETGSYLEAGWTFRSPLNGTKAVVEWAGRVG